MSDTENENTADAARRIVRFDRNGGTGTAPKTMKTDAGGTVTLPGLGFALMKANCVFAGWLASPAGTGEAMRQGSKYAPTSDITLYAQWIQAEELAPVAITVAGFESGVGIGLFVMDEAGGYVFHDSAPVKNGKAVFAGLKFPAGSYEIVLRRGVSTDVTEWRSCGLLALNSGDNCFELATNFTETKATRMELVGMDNAGANYAAIKIRRGAEEIAYDLAMLDGGRATEDGSVVFCLRSPDERFVFSGGGTFEIRLELLQTPGRNPFGEYRIASRNLNAGTTNVVRFGEFAEMPPLSITVSGIPETYSGFGSLDLHFPETGLIARRGDNTDIAIPDTDFSVTGVPAGIYDLLLYLRGRNGPEILRLNSRGVGEKTSAEFCEFAPMPATRITVAGMEFFDGLKAEITVENDATDGRFGKVRFGEATFTLIDGETMLPSNRGGAFRLELSVAGERWEITETIIPGADNRFAFADFGGEPPLALTVTDIPDSLLYYRHFAKARVVSGTAEIASGNVHWDSFDDSACCILRKTDGDFFCAPGTFSLELEFMDGDGGMIAGDLASKFLAAGVNVIPFSDFAVASVAITVDNINLAGACHAEITVTKDRAKVASAECSVARESAVFFPDYLDNDTFMGFDTPGTYRLRLTLENEQWVTLGVYDIVSKTLTTGTNTIPFAEFTPVMSIAIEGINVSGAVEAHLNVEENPAGPDVIGKGERTANCWEFVKKSRAFFLPGLLDENPAPAESCSLYLGILNEHRTSLGRYIISSKPLTAGENVIPFAEFLRETILIVREIDVAGASTANLCIYEEGHQVFHAEDFSRESKSSMFLPKTESGGSFPAGTYELALFLKDGRESDLGEYRIASKTLAPGVHFIRFGDFAPPTSITVDGKTIAGAKNASLHIKEGESLVARADGWFVADGWLFADDKTFRPNAGTDGFIPTGTYRLELHLADNRWETLGIYCIASKTLAAGANVIPFSDFRKAGLQEIAD